MNQLIIIHTPESQAARDKAIKESCANHARMDTTPVNGELSINYFSILNAPSPEARAIELPGEKEIEKRAAQYGNIDYPIPYGYVGSANDFINGANFILDFLKGKGEGE